MPVIINDFEVMVEPPRQDGGAAPAAPDTAQSASETQTLRPADIDRIVRHFEERRKRVWAD